MLFAAFSCQGSKPAYRVLKTPFAITDELGNARRYRLFLPEGEALPLLVYFHAVQSPEFANVPTLRGYTGSPVEETGLIDFCRQNRIALLVPEAFYAYSFLGCEAKGWVIEREMDGVEKMIAAATGSYAVDRKRIFLAGISAGAVFCHFLANHRPESYAAILSHSQGYRAKDNSQIEPAQKGPLFGVLFAYTQGDYPQLKRFCNESEAAYRERGYRTHLLADLPPESHTWAVTHNAQFWKWLNKLAAPAKK